jgi:hypothetical protein
MKIICFASALLLAASPAMAAWDGVQNAHVTFDEGNQGAAFIYVDVPPQGAPSCSTQGVGSLRYAISESTAIGKTQLAIALSAMSRGATVIIQGAGICTAWGDTEDIAWIRSN